MHRLALCLALLLAACAAQPTPEPAPVDTPEQAKARAAIQAQGEAAAAANDMKQPFPNLGDVPARPERPTSPEEGEALIQQMQQDAAAARGAK